MSLPYIRRVYKVPAYRGRIIGYNGFLFRITSAQGTHLRVVDLDDGSKWMFHPTFLIDWGVEQ